MVELSDFLPLVIMKTAEGRLRWREEGVLSYVVKVDDLQIRVSHDDSCYSLSLLSEGENPIETFAALPDDTDFHKLVDLWELARRQILGIDQALNKLKQALDTV